MGRDPRCYRMWICRVAMCSVGLLGLLLVGTTPAWIHSPSAIAGFTKTVAGTSGTGTMAGFAVALATWTASATTTEGQ